MELVWRGRLTIKGALLRSEAEPANAPMVEQARLMRVVLSGWGLRVSVAEFFWLQRLSLV